MSEKRIVFIVGPTAVGKSQVALEVAKKLKTELISCDAMQVYREIDILNDKPRLSVRSSVPHHLVDCVSITEEFDVVRYRRQAVEAIERLHRAEKIPVVVGGSGMYMTVLLDGIFEMPAASGPLRAALEEEADAKGLETLYLRLQAVDPKLALKVTPNDRRRIVRALEVAAATGRPISELHTERQGLWGQWPVSVICLNRNREELYRRINARVDAMFDAGAVSEIAQLKDRPWSKTARGLIGYKEITGYIAGEYDLDRTKYLVKLHSRHYAKRQLTWFRRDKRLQWLMIEEAFAPETIAGHICSGL